METLKTLAAGYTLTRRSMLVALAGAAAPVRAKINGVEIGVCSPVKDFAAAGSFGFDYFEPAVAEIAALSDDAFAGFRKQVESSRLRCSSCNSFIRSLRVVGPSVDENALRAYMNRSLDRCRQLGTEIVVWGSASSRNVPEGYSRDKAWGQIKAFLTGRGHCSFEQYGHSDRTVEQI
jgi:hypothetical protein